MNNRRWLWSAARSIVFLLQLGLSILLPPVLCALGAWYAQEHWAWGGWVWPVALGLGLMMGGASFAEFARYMQREARTRPLTDWEEPSPPVSTPVFAQKNRADAAEPGKNAPVSSPCKISGKAFEEAKKPALYQTLPSGEKGLSSPSTKEETDHVEPSV